MRIFVVDAFTGELFRGNQAGVVILNHEEPFPGREYMKALAAELKHSETAYLGQKDEETFVIRYFTPVEEVELCGHATISAFTVLRELGRIGTSCYKADTLAGILEIHVKEDMIWMDMAEPKRLEVFDGEECRELYEACGIKPASRPDFLRPETVNTGLSDILLPVNSRDELNKAQIDTSEVRRISLKYDVTGIHLFCMGDKLGTSMAPDPILAQDCGLSHEMQGKGITAYCRNTAPLYGISEEAATGTSNGALTYYLKQHRLIQDDEMNLFVQGEAMGKPSCIYTTIRNSRIQIGGRAVISLECRRWTPDLHLQNVR